MTITIGHIGVSASFDPTARKDGKLAYQEEAEKLKAADSARVYSAFTFGIPVDAQEDCRELCEGLRRLGFSNLRGIVQGIELCDPAVADESLAALLSTLKTATQNGITKLFTVAQEWPAGSRDADFNADLVPAFVSTVSQALKDIPEIEEFGIEPLISVEQQHVNSLARARLMARLVNEELGQNRVFPVPDVAHLFGLVNREFWTDITDQLVDAIAAGEVPYAHLSIPESRTDNIVRALQAGDVPSRALRALRQVKAVDTEGFDPNDQFLGDLRRLVPKFESADDSGWKDGKRFHRFAEAAVHFRDLG